MKPEATAIGSMGLLCLALSLLNGTGASAQSIFDFDEPTTRPSTGGATAPQRPEIDLPPGPITAPPDRYYLFPPVAWEDATSGVVRLTAPPISSAPTTRPTTVPVVRELPPIRPANVAALRRRYAALIGEQQVKDYDSVYGADERRAAGRPAELMLLMGTLKDAAKDVTDQPELQRYLLLRAFVAARDAGATVGTLNEIAEQIRPTLGQGDPIQGIPSLLLQRAEVDGAVADAVLEARQKGQDVATMQNQVGRAARSYYDVALWQEQHYYLTQMPDMIARAEYYARVGKGDAILRVCSKLRTLMEDWSRMRGQFLEKYHAWRAAPDDPKANAEYARLVLIVAQNVQPAVQAALKSGDPVLKAVGEAAMTRDLVSRNGAVGLALVPMIDAASGKERTILIKLAVGHLEQFVRASRTSDANYTKGRLYLSRLKTQVPAVPPTDATAGGGGANGAAGAGATDQAAGNPVFVETAARRVIYVLDGSGSMMNKFDVLRTAVGKAVAELKPTQLFDVVVMHEDDGVPFNKQAVPATDANKNLFYAFMKRTAPHGSSDPIVALRFAFAQNPDAVYFLTDGDFPNNNQVVAEIRKLNAARRTKIHTIAFMDRGEDYEKILRQISEQSGGTFRFISDGDVANLK
ncbi:MAG: hypothetical protein JWN40_942 [Phycisphaerales bacterium]|nr:hypothetical protein [Phycisphaerales bacterium]